MNRKSDLGNFTSDDIEDAVDRTILRTRKAGGCIVVCEGQDTSKYARVSIRSVSVRCHRLMCDYFNGKIECGLMVRHLCHNPLCVNPVHLAVGTHRDNTDDMVSAGRQGKGSRVATSVFSELDVREIRRRFANGESQYSIAKNYGVAHSSIGRIVAGINWSHLPVGEGELGFDEAKLVGSRRMPVVKMDEESAIGVKFFLKLGYKHREIAEILGITKPMVENIKYGLAWVSAGQGVV